MQMPTTRISESDHRVLQALSAQTGKGHQEIIHEGLNTYQREAVLDGINAGYAKLKADQLEWAIEKRERQLWEHTLADGIDE